MNSKLQQHLKQYRESEQSLLEHIRSTMPFGSIVHVRCPGRFIGYGTRFGHEARADVVAVKVKNFNTWDYPVEFVRPILEEEKATLPKWIKEWGK